MNLILSTPSIAYANAISAELWNLTRPASVRKSETTSKYCGTFEHPTEDKVAIGPLTENIRIHLGANEKKFIELVSAAVTEEEASALPQAIASAKGTKVNIVDIVTGAAPSLIDNFRTKEEMEAEGWFEQPVEEEEEEVEEVIEV
jgi:hypothetical protein